MHKQRPQLGWQVIGALAVLVGFGLPTVAKAGSTAVAPASQTTTPVLLLRREQVPADPAAIRFSHLDRNKDTSISPAEAEFDASLSAQFNALDRDHSGALDISEYVAYTQHLARNLASRRAGN